MEISKGRISMRQAIIVFILSLGAPALRIVPNYLAVTAEEAGWVSAIVGLIPSLLLVWTLVVLFKKSDGSLYDIYEKIFGKILNKIITVIYIVWSLCLASLYLRMFGERFLGTILFEANLHALLIFMMAFIYFLVNQKIDVLGRMSEILIGFLMVIVVIVFLFTIPQIKIENIWPVTIYDTWPVIQGVLPLCSMSCYITAILFLGDKISDKRNLKKFGIIGMVALCIFTLILIFSTIGLFGYRMNAQFLFPYFKTLKNIKILNTIERIESLFISTWVGTDTIIISLFTLITLHLIRKLFNKNYNKSMSLWVCIIIFIVAILFAPNVYVAKNIARFYVGPINVILFMVVPFIALIVGKIRKIV